MLSDAEENAAGMLRECCGNAEEKAGRCWKMLVWESTAYCAKVAVRNVAEFLMAGLDDGRLATAARAV